ncbi:MAG: universal stress protein [Halovenus sp.]
MYDRILLPTDGSEGTTKPVEHAIEMARRYDADIDALAVIDERQFEGLADDQFEETQRALRENCRRAVDTVASLASEHGITVRSAIETGVPSQAILSYADDHPVDAIAMGTHGQTDNEPIGAVGSVTQRVVENARVPVLVLHID